MLTKGRAAGAGGPFGTRRRRDVVIVVAALLAGFGGAVFAEDARELFRRDRDDPAVAASTLAAIEGRTFDDVPPAAPDAEPVPAEPASTPSEALERFLAAEVAGKPDRSFALLSTAGRAAYRSPAAWQASHAGFFPIMDYSLVGVNDAGDSTEVVTDVRYRPSLDEVIGLVPARAEVTWAVVKEAGGWLVDFDGAEVSPRFPADAKALTAVERWALSRQDCEEADEYSAGLVGLSKLADSLCDARGRLTFGDVAPLDSDDSAAMVSAFGAPAVTWARTVRITGPVDLTAVLAPMGDRWLVVGVLAPQ